MRSLIIVLASGFGTGYAPVASGTFGSLVGIPLFFAFAPLAASHPFVAILVYIAAVAAACWIAGQAEEVFGEHDSGKIVIDEVVGYLATAMFLPATWTTAIAAFFVFRVLDVIKPYPASAIDARLEGGAGVVLDDVVSGLYGNLVMRLGFFLLGIPT